MKVLCVKNWDKFCETHETRKLKSLAWFAWQANMGLGYMRLVGGKEGVTHLGVFAGLMMVAAGCKKRGMFASNDVAHTIEDLSVLSRIPVDLLRSAIPRLASAEIGWLEYVDYASSSKVISPEDSPGILPDIRENPPDTDRQTDRTVHTKIISPTASPIGGPPALKPKTKEPAPQDAWFNEAWASYWRREHRSESYRAFCRHVKTAEMADKIAKAIRSQSGRYMEKEVQFRPLFATWLNKQRYLDEREDQSPVVFVSPRLLPLPAHEIIVDDPVEYIKLLETKATLGFITPAGVERERRRLGVP